MFLQLIGGKWREPPSKDEAILAKLTEGNWHNADANETED